MDAISSRYLESRGYENVRRLADGTWAGTVALLYTRAVCTGIDYFGHAYRYCFSDPALALEQLALLTEMDQEPTGWIARR